MASAPIIAQLGAKATVLGSAYSVESLRIRLGVNTLATASLVGIKKLEKVKMAMAPDVITEMRTRQRARLAGRTKADAGVEAKDGMGGTIRFVGFMTAPVMEISRNNIGDQLSLIAEDALIDGLDLSIYRTGNTALRAEADAGPLAAAYSEASEGYVLQMLSKITDVLVGEYTNSKSVAGTPSMERLIEQQHKTNIGLPLEIWKGILQNGDARFESWVETIAAEPDMRRTLCERAGSMLQQNASGFWQVLTGVMAAFQLHYVPSPDGRGRIMLAKHKTGSPTGTIDLHATKVTATDGSVKILQPGGVVMLAASAQRARQESTLTGENDPRTIAGQFPKPLLSGYIHREPAPFWILDSDGHPTVAVGTSDETDPLVDYSLEQYMVRLEDADRKKDELDIKTVKLLDELCEITFNQIRLADSTATVVTPLNFKINVGERLRMNFGGGASFTGFVDNVLHSVDLSGGSKLASSTQLGITHVEY